MIYRKYVWNIDVKDYLIQIEDLMYRFILILKYLFTFWIMVCNVQLKLEEPFDWNIRASTTVFPDHLLLI